MYTRESLINTRGESTAQEITEWMRLRAANGLAFVRNQTGNKDLPLNPVPDDYGQIVIEECYRYSPFIVNSDILAAQNDHESAGLQSMIARDKNNYCGYGAENHNPYELAQKFDTMREGIAMQVRHMLGYTYGDGVWNATEDLSPRYSLVKKNGWAGKVKKLYELEQKWAYTNAETYNKTALNKRYGAKIADAANSLVEYTTEEWSISDLKIAIGAGHHNTSGGNSTEYKITAGLTELYYKFFKMNGVDVRCITPDGPDADDLPGDGDYTGTLYDAAYQVTKWYNEGWMADVFFEVHTEGAGVPGTFGIFPDWGTDVDGDARDFFIPRVVNAITKIPNFVKRNTGVMSEKQTGVGISGYRLGVFRATEAIASHTTRFIIEHAAHDIPAERDRLLNPEIQAKIVEAAGSAIITELGFVPKKWNSSEGVEPNPVKSPYQFTDTIWVVPPIYDYHQKLTSVGLDIATLGLVQTPVFSGVIDGIQRPTQIFERTAVAVYEEGTPHGVPASHPMHVRQLLWNEELDVRRQARELGWTV